MKHFDFHGMDKKALEHKVDNIVGEIRLNESAENYEFITGEGVLKEHLKTYLKKEYNLDYVEAHNSSGIINVFVE